MEPSEREGPVAELCTLPRPASRFMLHLGTKTAAFSCPRAENVAATVIGVNMYAGVIVKLQNHDPHTDSEIEGD